MTDLQPLMRLTTVVEGYHIEVWPYMLGQYRIMLIHGTDVSGFPHVTRQMCTYQRETAIDTMVKLSLAEDPEAFCRELEKPWNCEYPGGRIRLDNRPGDRMVTVTEDQP